MHACISLLTIDIFLYKGNSSPRFACARQLFVKNDLKISFCGRISMHFEHICYKPGPIISVKYFNGFCKETVPQSIDLDLNYIKPLTLI